MLPKILTLPLKGIYFDQIKAGEKIFEYRLRTPYWKKRLENKEYDLVTITKGYPKRNDETRRLTRKWRGFHETTINHPHFGPNDVQVYAIYLGK